MIASVVSGNSQIRENGARVKFEPGSVAAGESAFPGKGNKKWSSPLSQPGINGVNKVNIFWDGCTYAYTHAEYGFTEPSSDGIKERK